MPGKRRENVVQKMLVDPGSMVDDSMPEVRREAEALGADAVALAEWRIRTECRCGIESATGMGSCAASRPGQS